MVTGLHNILRSLCVNTEWSYALFWKLKHGSPMVLTMEDAYYDNRECQYPTTLANSQYDPCSHDPLELALASMSYIVYTIGEGIVGQVALSGKYHWILADKLINNFNSSFQHDGWQSQFSAGIKTIVVLSVVPYGVVQLGSLNMVIEDLKLVADIKDIFSALPDSSTECITTPILSSMKSTFSLSDLPSNSLPSEFTPYCLSSISNESLIFPRRSFNAPNLHHETRVGGKILDDIICEETKNLALDSDHNYYPHLVNHNMSLYNYPNDSVTFPESSSTKLQDTEMVRSQTVSNPLNSSNTLFKFSAGCELEEALRPRFVKGGLCFDLESEKNDSRTSIEMFHEMNSGQFISDSGSENLLEAVVANVCSGDVKGNQSLSNSESEQTLYSTIHSINQLSFVETKIQHCLNTSEVCGTLSLQGFSSGCSSSFSELSDTNSEPAKISKRKARAGESSRPRPRDRQLIQDRIKELREIVPNGSKCSIDSLLERTIKHMLFLQSISKHADKLKNCTELKLHRVDRSLPGSSNNEQGSSWAVEVGSHLKVCSIVVENVNQNGQMLVEMMCEECSHFLEIAEAIRNLGLTILKGITELHDKKTWICFVVEGQENQVMHRMDILWSLVKVFQPSSAVN